MIRRFRGLAAGLILFLSFGSAFKAIAQNGAPQRAAHLAYDAEMAEVGNDCPDQLTLEDRNECLNNVRVQTYKNFDAFFAALREALIDESPNDSNALALDAAQLGFEKYRTQTCDAVSNVYDVGTIKHPGSTRPSARTRCLIDLTRSRMRDLAHVYEPSL
jgi:uncharacterized protein YecT (DUF1311 family)